MYFTNWWKNLCARIGNRSRTARRKRNDGLIPVRVQTMESRQLLSAAGIVAAPPVSANLDGTGNNAANPTWGAAGSDLLRIAPAAYGDGISTPAGTGRPSAREISNVVSDHPDDPLINDRDLSNFVYAWGQFIDHDLDLTVGASPATTFNIAIPKGDPMFDPLGTGTQVISLNRSAYDPKTGTSTSNPRQQVNSVTSYIDASMVYGSDSTRAAALRTFSGGKLKMDGNLLPSNINGLPNANDTHQTPDDQLFLAGDVRANENIELTALHTLFVREHNRIVDQLAKSNPKLTDEQLYQLARAEVIAEVQAITFNEWLPALLGPNTPGRYLGYNPRVNAGVSNEFSTAAFRFGHSMLGDDIEFLDNNGVEIREPIALMNAFFNPNVLRETGIDPLLKYLSTDRAEEIDLKVVDSLRNFLFGEPGQGGLDLVSLNIQRGRDHGLADYNTTRAAFGLPKVTSFSQITSNKKVQEQLKSLYGSVDKIDLWVGGLAEDHLRGSSLGATFTQIIADQFNRLRAGDSNWYQRKFSGAKLAQLEHTRLSDVIRRNTGLTNLQDNVFFFHATIAGRVLAEGRKGTPPIGIVGLEVQLTDANGIVMTTRTRRDGSFVFDRLSAGSYQLTVVFSSGQKAPPRTVSITRGMLVDQQNFWEVATPKKR